MSNNDLLDFSAFAVGTDAPAAPDFSQDAVTPAVTSGASLSPIPTQYMDAIKGLEGFSGRSKWDYKQHTNGFGTKAKYPGEVIDESEANKRFVDEMGKAAKAVDDFAPGLPDGIRASLASLTFNSGADWQRMGLGAAIKTGDFEDAGKRFNQYVNAGGKPLQGLIDRRTKEYQWWFDHVNDGAVSETETNVADLKTTTPEQMRDKLLDAVERATGKDMSGYRHKDEPQDFSGDAVGLDFSSMAIDPGKAGSSKSNNPDLPDSAKGAFGDLWGILKPEERRPAGEDELKSAQSAAATAKSLRDRLDPSLKRIASEPQSALDWALKYNPVGWVSDKGVQLADYLAEAYQGTQDKRVTSAQDALAGKSPLPAKTASRSAVEGTLKSAAKIVPWAIEHYGQMRGYGTQLGEKLSGRGVTSKVEDDAAYKFGKGMDDWLEKQLPGDQARQQQFVQQAAQGIGSTVGFWGPGAVAKLLGAGEKGYMAAIALAGIQAQSADKFNEITKLINEGKATEQDRLINWLAGIPLGASEALPFAPTIGGPLKTVLGGRVASGFEQAIEEALQEGGQGIGENLAAKKTYDPKRNLLEGVPEGMAIGGITGGLFGAALGKSEGMQAAAQDAPQPTPQPIPGQTPPPVPGPVPAQPAAATSPPDVAPPSVPATARSTARVSPEDIAVLKGQGWTDADIAEMGDEELAQTVIDARDQTAPPKTTAEPVAVPDTPSAEPVSDLTAQIESMRAGERKGVYLSPDNLANLRSNPDFVTAISKAIHAANGEMIANVDGKGGVLVAANPGIAKGVTTALQKGTDTQAVIGEVTGAGSGKPAGGSSVVQQKTKSGAVTRESLVTPDQVQVTEQAFAGSGKTVETVSPGEAIARRNEGIAAEHGAAVQGDGTRAAPVQVTSAEDVARAGAKVAEPTPAQAENGNYQKGHIRFQGLPISIETPKGGTRRGVKDGVTQWEVPDMPAAYGYIRGSTGADGEQVDVFIGDNVDSDKVYLIDQLDLDTKSFDEHKAVLGANTATEAAELYAGSFSDGNGMARIGAISEMPLAEFKSWAKAGEQTAPVAEHVETRPDFSNQAIETTIESSRERMARPTRPERYDGPDLSEAEIDTIVDSWRYVQDVNRRGRPESLAAFVIDRGGLKDDAMEVRHIAGAAKERPGLVNSDGETLDDAALAAWEAGFFTGSERPDIAEFLDALQNDLQTGTVVRSSDEEWLEDIRIASDIETEIADYGVTTNWFRTEASLRDYFGQKRPRTARAIETDEETETAAEKPTPRARAIEVADAPFDLPEKSGSRESDAEASRGAVAETPDGGPAEEPLTAQDIETIVKAWRYVKAIDEQVQAGRSVPDAKLDKANELDADLADYGVTIEDYPDEDSLRQYLGGSGESVAEQPAGTEDQQSAAQDKASEDPVKPFDPYAFSVQVVLAKDGQKALKERLSGLKADELLQIIDKQHLAVSEAILERGDLGEITTAMVQAAKKRLQDRGAAAGDGQTSPVPDATTKEKIASQSNALTVQDGLHVNIGGRPHPVESWEQVSKAFRSAIETANLGASEMPRGPSAKIFNAKGDVVAHVSYNGRVWAGSEWKPGDKPLYEPESGQKTGSQPPAQNRQSIEIAAGTGAAEAAKKPAGTPLDALRDRLLDEGFKTIIEARKFAKEHGIDGTNKDIDEAIETAVVAAARQTIAEGGTPLDLYHAMIALYDRQPNLGVRTSTSVTDQAYSTPMPLAYLASRLAGIDTAVRVYEPTAGNGALLIEAETEFNEVFANEINPSRAAYLKELGFKVKSEDATGHGIARDKTADAVIMNPPFGAVREDGQSKTWTIDDFTTTSIDHAIALNALKAMTDDGKAVLILGGIKAESLEERRAGYRGQGKRNFFAKLYKAYNVTDHFTVSGDLYKKQGAGWPVDVVVIEGRGQSQRLLPAAEPPAIFNSWDELEGKLPNGTVASDADQTAVGHRRQNGGPDQGERGPESGNAGGVTADVRGGAERLHAEGQDKSGGVRGDSDRGKPADVRPDRDHGRDHKSQPDGLGGRVGEFAAPRREPVERPERKAPPKGSGQALYRPSSNATSLDTLVPVNMADATKSALDRVAKKHGDLDAFVADRLGYDEDLSKYFSAEQVDALATAIDNVERGAGFVIGDSTGVGKGRFVAGMIRYAMRKGWTPVFVTEKPDLYGDMFRDMTDIGLPKMLGREPNAFMTNTGESVPLDDEAMTWKQEADQARSDGQPIPSRRGRFLRAGGKAAQDSAMGAIVSGKAQHDIVFTTYDQMNTIKQGETDRRNFLRAISPNSLLILDESHNAGGQGEKLFKKKGLAPDRAEFVRDLVKNAAGVVYSSATFAKRPDVMDLYARTDMGKAVDDPKMLPALIQRGGVPMQQIVATMLSDAGQYMRRERSFEGVDYAVEPVDVNDETYRQFSDAVRSVFEFDMQIAETRDEFMADILDRMGASKAKDSGIGEASAHSTAFASIMHNIVNQMLLSIKADKVADRAITATKAGEKPVIALASTMESFIRDFATDVGINTGSTIDISFGDVLRKYLERTLRITVKDENNTKKHIQIPVDQLPLSLQHKYREALGIINDGSYQSMPVSPIDWIRHRLTKAGLSVAEVTGRQTMVNYDSKVPKYAERPKSEMGPSGKRSSIAAFNRGALDAIILNRSGSTGVSMHAGAKFKDQRPRRMIIAQAEANIDTHLQMLGRVHRTGQVVTPGYSQIAASIPAEARPTAVLMKKMASLNANTTGARSSVFMADAIDFMNEYGDRVVASIIADDSDLNAKLGSPLKENDKGLPIPEDAARRVTGRLVLLSPKDQTELLNRIQDEYKAEIERLDALGENALEAKTIDLKAKVLDTTPLKDKTGEGPFKDSAQIEKVSVKAQGRAMSPAEVVEAVSKFLRVTSTEGSEQASLGQLEAKGRAWTTQKIEEVDRRAREWIAEDVASKSEDARPSVRTRHKEGLERWTATARLAAPGARVTLKLNDRQMHGIVLSLERTGKAKNPVALGAWRVKVAVPDSARTIDLPMSKLYPHNTTKSDDEPGIEIVPSQVPFSGLISQLDDARREGREERYMVTGNILAGYDQVHGKGQIVNFTMDDGSLRPGILMSRDFLLDKFMTTRTVRLRSGDQVAEFLDKAPMGEVRTSDKFVTLSFNRGTWTIETPAGRATGGRYYTDSRVRDALRGKEFQKYGGVMRAELDRAGFVRVAEAIRSVGGLFETTGNQDLAQDIVRKSSPADEAVKPISQPPAKQSGTKQSEAGKAISDFKATVDDLKARTGITTKQRTFGPDEDDILAAISGTVTVIPETMLDEVKAVTSGSRMEIVGKYVAQLGADAETVVSAIEKATAIDLSEASIEELQTFVVAVEDLQQVAEKRLQDGYKMNDAVDELGELLQEKISQFQDAFYTIETQANAIVERLEGLEETLSERFDELAAERFGEDQDAIEAWVDSQEEPASQDVAVYDSASLDENDTQIDVLAKEAIAGSTYVTRYDAAADAVLAMDVGAITTLDQAYAALERVGQVRSQASHVAYWMDKTWDFANNDVSASASDLIEKIKDEQITPITDKIEKAQGDLDTLASGIEEAMETAVDEQEIADGKIIEIDGTEYGPTMVQNRISEWTTWLDSSRRSREHALSEPRASFATPEWESRRRGEEALVEADLAAFEAALARYEAKNQGLAAIGASPVSFDAIEEAVLAGKTYIMPEQHVRTQLDALRPMLKILPDRTRFGVLEKIEPEPNDSIDPYHQVVKTHYRMPNGSVVTARFKLLSLRDLRAFARTSDVRDGAAGVFFHNIGPVKNLGETVSGQAWHEGFHILRQQNRIVGEDWRRLLGHAAKLRILDRHLGEFLTSVGSGDNVDQLGNATIRQAYSRLYANRADNVEIIRQESITHMLELWVHGAISDADMEPVRDILEDIRSGKVSGNSSRAVRGAEPVFAVNRSQPDQDSLGFTSKLLRAAYNLRQERGTPEQMLAMLKKEGAKDAELEATGLGKFLSERSGSNAGTGDAGSGEVTVPSAQNALRPGLSVERRADPGNPNDAYDIKMHGEKIGQIHVGENDRTITNRHLFISQEFQRQGIGTEVQNHLAQQYGKPSIPDSSLSRSEYNRWLKNDPASVASYRLKSDGSNYYPVPSNGDRTGGTSGRADRLKQNLVTKDEIIKYLEENRVEVKGQPLFAISRLYHSTPAKFDRFSNEYTDEVGFHFGTKDQAHNRAYIQSNGNLWTYFRKWRDIPVEIDVTNPVTLSTDPGSFMPAALAKQLVKDNLAPYELIAQVQDKQLGPDGSPEDAKSVVRDYLVSKGYDAIRYPNHYEGTGDYSYMTFGTGNVKDARTGDILYALGVYHGSPHDFYRFDISKIGTGEGAQAYGHGLYFAENEGVAKGYRDQLSPSPYKTLDSAKLDAPELADATGYPQEAIDYAKKLLDEHGGKVAEAAKTASQLFLNGNDLAGQANNVLRGFSPSFKDVNPGHLYQVRINANPEDFLDWDKPLSGQSEKVRSAFSDTPLAYKDPVGAEAMHMMSKHRAPDRRFGDETGASNHLREAGIPGIRYLDQGSRTAGEGSYNYVVFDDSIIEVTHKNGVPIENMPLAGNVIKPAIDAKAKSDLVESITDAIEIVQRIAGQGLKVEFHSDIPASYVLDRTPYQADEARNRGLTNDSAGGFYRPGSLSAEALIGLSTNAPGFDLATTAGHEAWHHVETALATAAERNLLAAPSEIDRMRRLAASELGLESDDSILTAMPDYEVRAYAFQRYRRLREDGAGSLSGLHIGVRKFFDRLIRVFHNVSNAVRGLGYDSFESIFERARTGGMAQRKAEPKLDTTPPPIPDKIIALIHTALAKTSNDNPDLSAEWASHVSAFMSQRLGQSDGDSVAIDDLEGAYAMWAEDAGVEPLDAAVLSREMMKAGVSTMRIAGANRFIGLRLLDENEQRPANPTESREKDAFDLARDAVLGFSIKQAVSRQIERLKSVIGEKPDFARIANLEALQQAIANDDSLEQDIYDNVVSMMDDPVLGNVIPRTIEPGRRSGGVLGRKVRRTLARASDRSDAARVLLQDKALPIRRIAVERVENETGAKVPLNLDTYVAEGLFHGRAGERMADLQDKRIEPFIEHLRRSGLTVEEVGEYLYARHALERNAAIGAIDPTNLAGSGMTDAEATEILNRARQSGKQAQMDQAAAMVDQIITEARDTLLRSGLIDRETYDAWSMKYQNYVPLRGFELGEEENPDRIRSGRGFDIKGPESRRALGRRSKADNPVMYAILQAEQSIVRAEKNRVNKTLYRMIQANPNPAVWAMYRGESKRRVNPTTGMIETYWVLPPFVRNDAVHGVKINGKQFWMELKHPSLARAMRGVGSEIQGTIVGRAMMSLTRTYAQLLTSWNPEFMVSNFFRDVETALLNVSDLAGKSVGARRQIIKDALSLTAIRGAYNALRGDGTSEYARWFDEFRLAGGKISFMEYNDVARIKKNINASLKAGNMRRALRAVSGYVEDINTSVENGVRLSAYIALRKAGIEKDRAAFTARELTVNFNRKGEIGPAINSMYLFFNASIQGTTRVAQAFARSRAVKYAVAGIFSAGLALDFANMLMAGDDDDGKNRYDKIPEWVRDRNIIIMNPFGTGDYITIPMAYGYNLPYLAGQEVMRMARGKSSPLGGAARITSSVLDAFNPLGSSNDFWQMVSPTMLDPGVQVLENKTWYGGPIQPTKFDAKKPSSENYFTSAPWWAVDTAKILNAYSGGNEGRSGYVDISPEVIEHYVEFAGGGVAKFVANAINSGERVVHGEEWLPEKTPFVRRLYGKTTTQTRTREFYEVWDDVDRANYEVKTLSDKHDRAGAEEARQKYGPELRVYGAMKGAKKALKNLRAQRDKIKADSTLDRETLQARISDIDRREKELIARVLKQYHEAQKRNDAPPTTEHAADDEGEN